MRLDLNPHWWVQNDIRKNPAFRSQFHEMCTKVGVDPLASNKGFWAELLGIGDFYYELGWYHLLYIVAYGENSWRNFVFMNFFPSFYGLNKNPCLFIFLKLLASCMLLLSNIICLRLSSPLLNCNFIIFCRILLLYLFLDVPFICKLLKSEFVDLLWMLSR